MILRLRNYPNRRRLRAFRKESVESRTIKSENEISAARIYELYLILMNFTILTVFLDVHIFTIHNDLGLSKPLPPYYKPWFKVIIGLKLMLSVLFAKEVTVTESVLS
jgi:hypothetical protein